MENIRWKKADDPPKTKPGLWSADVVVITNYGNVFCIAYFGDSTDGIWQRPARFSEYEQVEYWIEKP